MTRLLVGQLPRYIAPETSSCGSQLQVEKAENGRAMVGGKRKCTVDWSRKNEEVKNMKVENGKVKNKQAQNEKAKNSRVKGKGRCTIDWS